MSRWFELLIRWIMGNNYSMPAMHFMVQWGGVNINFDQVSGLEMELEVISNRGGASPVFSAGKMPGAISYKNIVLKRGVRKGDNEFFEWLDTAALNQIERRDVTISLLDEAHNPVITWKLTNAFPVKLYWSELNSASHEPLQEFLELAHEGFTVEYT